MERIVMNETCHRCNQPAYKGTREGVLCIEHYIEALKEHLGPWVELSDFYQQAKRDKMSHNYSTIPLFQQMELKNERA